MVDPYVLRASFAKLMNYKPTQPNPTQHDPPTPPLITYSNYGLLLTPKISILFYISTDKHSPVVCPVYR